MFDNKSIMITGGTGSFGKQCIKTILSRYKPKRLIVFSRDELKQFEMQQGEYQHPALRYFLGDIRDEERLVQAMQGVDYVFHAAALKQVPAAEYNPMEFIKTNINGTENVIKAAMRNEVMKVIVISTDKAVSPANLYGATKLVAEKLCVAANNMAGGHRTRFAVVRYGNVAGSRGSVIPHFRRLISEGAKELPVTDERMTRFWLTIKEGVDFALKSMERMQGGEVFIPKIPSIRIVDLVESLKPGMPIKIVGIRPGEKLHEVLCPADGSHLTLEFNDHFVIKPTINFVVKVNYQVNPLGEKGVPVEPGFEYNSGNNPHFLTVAQIREMNQAL
ncbi:MAG: UDP-N-acetylglucosamine 4,6-dehydratase (inverting) [Bacteroidota bacterium]